MANTCYFEEPPEPGRTPLNGHEDRAQQISEKPQVVVGQAVAERKVLGLMYKYIAVQSPPNVTAAVLVGPEGCGKSSLISECARKSGLPLASVRLSEVDARGALESLALERLSKLAPGSAQSGRGIVHVEGLEDGASAAFPELASVLRDSRDTQILVCGKRVRADSARFLWFAEIRSSQSYDEGAHLAKALCPHVVRLKALTKKELFEVLAISELSPLFHIKRQLKNLGVELDISELALWRMVNQALETEPGSGAKALIRQVAELELSLWAALSEANRGDK